ncbi:MAG: hypothetical protein V1495_01575 [Pseudomonadota bacterium]
MKRILSTSLTVLLLSCFGGSSGLNDAKQVTGTVYAANGTDVIAGATIYIPTGSSSSPRLAPTRIRGLAAQDGTACDDPVGATCASACSGVEGTFTLDTSSCSGDEAKLTIVKGVFRKTIDLNCSGGTTCALTKNETTLIAGSGIDGTKIAVVAGAYDRMQDVLAKLGYGTIDSNGNLTLETETFTLFDGAGHLPSKYQIFDKLLDGTVDLNQFDIVFLNCGLFSESMLTQTTVRSRLRSYVEAGGKIFATDLSYDFIEQVFPEVMKFEGDPDDAFTPGARDAAELGTKGDTVEATVNNTTMKDWLSGVKVNSGTTLEACDRSALQVNGTTGALNSDGTIHIGDLGEAWAEMHSAHTGQNPTIWIQGEIEELTKRPLTVSMEIGTKGGKVLFTSYHTAENCPSAGFWPQERILQYLVFEM